MNSVAICHIPHSSTLIPADVRSSLLLSDDDLKLEILRMTDWFTDEIFNFGDDSVTTVRYPISRLVLDPERFVDDQQEVMAARGMGVIYTRTSHGMELRADPSPTERQSLIEKYYVPHHEALSDSVGRILSNEKGAILIDCHSFASVPLPYEIHQDPKRPEICLGTDDYHTPSWLVDFAAGLFAQAGFSVDINRPFAGALVPAKYLNKDRAVCAMMIELNRGLYMNEQTGERIIDFPEVSNKVRSVVLRVIEAFQGQHHPT